MNTREAIVSALTDHGKRSETDLLISLRGLLGLGTALDDYRDILDEMVDKGEVAYETDEYHQEEIYFLATTPRKNSKAAEDAVKFSTEELTQIASECADEDEGRTAREKEYDEILRTVVLKPGGHVPAPLPEKVAKHGGKRLYAVTTIASSARYGGTCTPVVCDDFEIANKIVLENQGDIWEHSYMLVVIEATVCNWLYSNIFEEQYWYMWQDGGYKPIECPEVYRSSFGFGIG